MQNLLYKVAGANVQQRIPSLAEKEGRVLLKLINNYANADPR